MSDAAIDVLKANLEKLSSSMRWLNRSQARCLAIGIKETFTDDEFDDFENLTSRYARTTDLIVNKVLRSIDTVEFLDSGSVIDAANRAEKRGLVDSVSRLRAFKDLRNEIAHEYQTDDLRSLFEAVMNEVPELIATAERIAVYGKRYF